ncbi:MAG TPA: ABC transporter permease [Phototrophicaceae bacterium]|jgi:ABC-type dipeptide/oligopeptide/nickel transport system permease component|nr:ABC transporter permease [Phototrophicaceae bacterium]
MAKFVARRILWMIMVLFVISLITFVLMRSVPGGPFTREKALPEATLKLLNEKYNLDAPFIEQYLDYVTDILVPRVTYGKLKPSTAQDYLVVISLPSSMGDQAALRWMNFGPTYKSRSRSVNDIFRENLPISFQLGLAALAVAVAIGVPLGIISALKRNTFYDYFGMGTAIIGVSVPVIISAPLLQYIFGVQLKILPVTGWGDIQSAFLPALALGFVNAALIARLTRASLLQVLNEDFIRTARAKGLPERVVIIVHALKNSMIPVVTILGPLLAALVTGSFVVETIFGIPGMGRYFVTSITGRDYPVIMGTLLLYAFFLVVMNLFVDIAYAWLDPRIRFD